MTLLAVTVLGLLAVPAASAQSVEITSGPAVAPDYPMRVQVDDFNLVDYSNRDSNNAGEGHIHYLINGETATEDLSYATPSTTFNYDDLSVGDTVTAQLVNNDHSAIDPVAKASQEVGAGTPGFALPATVAAAAVALAWTRYR